MFVELTLRWCLEFLNIFKLKGENLEGESDTTKRFFMLLAEFGCPMVNFSYLNRR